MNRKPSYVSLSAHFEGIANAIDARLKASKLYLQHPSIGFSAEAYFRDLLRSYLPSRYVVESGFVVDASGERSDHIDIVVADTFHIPALCSEPGYKVFAAESVCAVMEVTTSPKGRVKKIPKFEADIDKLAHVRRPARKREYIDFQPVAIDGQAKFLPARFTLEASPRCFLITSGDEWYARGTYRRNLVSALEKSKEKGNSSWINAALSMKHGLVWFTPYKEYETHWTDEDPLLMFLLLLADSVASFPTFKIEIRRYADRLPTI
jgi:hypothetical protein